MDNYEIPIEILETYNMKTLEAYKKDFGDNVDTEKLFYQTFLNQTDYICNKIVEGVATWSEYEAEKVARQFAREMLGSLDTEQETETTNESEVTDNGNN